MRNVCTDHELLEGCDPPMMPDCDTCMYYTVKYCSLCDNTIEECQNQDEEDKRYACSTCDPMNCIQKGCEVWKHVNVIIVELYVPYVVDVLMLVMNINNIWLICMKQVNVQKIVMLVNTLISLKDK